jgi:hypothetical protein
MTSIPPAPPVTPAAAAASAPTSAAAGSTAVLTQLPSAVRAISPGTVITGTVTGRDQQGQTLIQTDSGVIAMKTAANLAVGSQVSLQVQAAGSQLQAVILSAIAPKPGAAAGTVPTATTPAGGAAATTIASTVATGSVLTATVIGPAPAAAAQTATLAAPLRPGAPPPAAASTAAPTQAVGAPPATTAAPLPGPVVTGSPPPAGATTPGIVPAGVPPLPATAPAGGPSPAPGAPATTPAVTPGGTPALTAASPPGPAVPAAPNAAVPQAARTVSAALASYAAAPGTPPAPPTATTPAPAASVPLPSPAAPGLTPGATPTPVLQPQPAGTQVQIRLAAPAGSPTPSTVPVQATLVGRTPAGQAIIDTPLGRLAVNLPPSTGTLPLGSALALEIVSFGSLPGSVASLAPGSQAAAARSLPTLGHEWSSLKAAMGALGSIDPPLARQILEISLPRLGTARFLGQVLNQLASGSARDAKALLGDTAHAVLERNGRADLLARLDAELREMMRLNGSASDWNVMFLPLVDVHELRQMRVYTRKKKPGGKGRDPGRFVVEVEFDQLGEVQIDGLIQKPRIDLILRSHVELEPGMQAGIAEVFGRTCESSGLIGKIFFQATAQFPVAPLDEITSAGPGLSI